MMHYENFIEMSYSALREEDIILPSLGMAIFINDHKNTEKVAQKLLADGYVYLTPKLKRKYRGKWKNMVDSNKVFDESEIILIDVINKVVLDWSTMSLTENNIKLCEPFFTCCDDYNFLESGSIDYNFITYYRNKLSEISGVMSIVDTWKWKTKIQVEYLNNID